MRPPGLFISATGTDVGKTWVTRGLCLALRREGRRVCALKPYETGCAPDPADALALARASAQPALASAPGLYRAPAPLSPRAATLEGHPPPPRLDDLMSTVHALAQDSDVLLVEGAGGLLVPLGRDHTMADLATRLALPILLVARDGLGVLSHTLTACESAERRDLRVASVVLCRHGHPASGCEPSQATNAAVLAERLPYPVRLLPPTEDDDEALADAVTACHLLDDLPPLPALPRTPPRV